MKSEEELQAILDTYNDSCYPEEFLSGYTIMECLAERNGLCTFLVQDSSEEPFIAKCYDKRVCTLADHHTLLNGLQHKSLPKQTACFENDEMTVTVREYIEGIPLHRYAQDNTLSQQEIVQICVQLCDVLAYLHHRESPIIHRDIKPQNVIVRPDGSIVLIDFYIARVYRSDRDTDTMFFGTLAYAPPEQYGFSLPMRRRSNTAFRRPMPARIFIHSAFCCVNCLPAAPKKIPTSRSTVRSPALSANAQHSPPRSALPTFPKSKKRFFMPIRSHRHFAWLLLPYARYWQWFC